MKEKLGILLLGHGSKLPYNREVVEGIARIISEKHEGGAVVRTAYLNMDRPTISESIEALKNEGVTRIVAVPVFLAHGVHTRKDIPRVMGIPEGERQTVINNGGTEIEVTYAEPLGVDPRIAEVVYQRGLEALK